MKTDFENSNTRGNSINFLINTVPLNLKWNKDWKIYEIEIDKWDKDSDYTNLLDFKSNFHLVDILFEIHGRLLIFIPINNRKMVDSDLENLYKALKLKMGKNITLNLIKDPIGEALKNEMILEAIRKGIGEIITNELNQLGFKKIGSGGGVGEFLPPENWLGEEQVVENEKIKMFKAILLSIIPQLETNEFFLAADLKGKYKEIQNLLDWINLEGYENQFPDNLKKKDKLWQIPINDETSKIFPNDIEREIFIIQSMTCWNEIQNELLGWGKYSKKAIKELVDEDYIPNETIEEPFIVFKPTGKVIKNPNIILNLPARFFYRHLSQPRLKDERHSTLFKRFTLVTPKERYKYISTFFKMLEEKKLAGTKIISKSYIVNYAKPGVGNNIVQEFGRAPKLSEWGVQSWGELKKIDLFFNDKRNLTIKIEELSKILKDQINNLLNLSKLSQIKFEIKLNPIKEKKLNFNRLIDGLNHNCCPIFIIEDKFNNYKNIKTKFTQEKGIPVQIIREDTVFRSRNLPTLVRTLIPQIIAKTGGLPYKLSPSILDNSILIGLDKARDSYGKKPSASAGIAAVTPEGHYISGASTPMENNSTDFIDVDKLAPDLLRELEEKKFGESYQYIVILRDGSPQTCMREVPQWKKNLQEYQKEFIFIASRKTHAFRLFPTNISDINLDVRDVKYEIPLVLSGKPLPPSDFLVLSARSPKGTPKPVLYTIMENTTSLSENEIKEKAIAQIISMSMLCWESPLPTSQPLPLHYAHKLAEFTQLVQQAWNSSNRFPMFI